MLWWKARLSASTLPSKVEPGHEPKAMIVFSLPRKEKAMKESPRPTNLDLHVHPKHQSSHWITTIDSGTHAYS